MRGNNVVGILFSNIHEELVHELTEKRTIGSIPFGGRYRLIDFPLSNMVNSGINKVGVITKGNYQSLMDHLGSGKAWDLSRKREGLFLLPPFGIWCSALTIPVAPACLMSHKDTGSFGPYQRQVCSHKYITFLFKGSYFN